MTPIRALPLLLLAAASSFLVACTTVPETAPEEVLQPRTGAIDDRAYRYLELPNGLRALVISDPETDKGAAALSVGVGSMADPPGREGLSHFLEHMLFLGTEKYPDPDEYNEYIGRHGGSHNAYTAQDHTNYFFDIGADHLRGALDRFAQFFVAPLFDADYVERETNAVHSEYQLQMREDGWRTFMTQKQAMNPEHPGSRFNIGSLETLADRAEAPIRDALLDFYARHYSADNMGLVILGREDLDTLGDWAAEMFAGVARREVDDGEPEMPLFRDEDLPALLEIEPVRELRMLQFGFPIPPLDPHYRESPGDYLANLIGHEGEGSLHAWLREQGWIDSLSAGASHYGRHNATMSVSIRLTESGFEHWQDVAEALFAYLEVLRAEGIDADRFTEQQGLARLAFDFREKGSPAGYVRGLASNLLVYPPEDVIRAPYAMDRFDPDLIGTFLEALRPQNALVTLIAPELATESVEPWFGVNYTLAPLPGSMLEPWLAATPPAGLTMPAANPFVPENLALLADGADAPQRLTRADPIEAWHLPDPSFGAPRATVRIDLRTRAADSAAGRVNANLYGRLVTDALNAYAYPARLAGLSYSLRGDRSGLALTLGGFDDKLEVLLDVVLETMVDLELRPERFEHYRRELIRELRNRFQERPYQRTMSDLRRLLESPEFAIEELIAAAEHATLEDLEAWIATALDTPGLLTLLHGNLADDRAGAMARRIRDILDATTPDAGPDRRLVRLDDEPVHLQVAAEHDDSALSRYVQGRDQSWAERARFGLLAHMLSTPYFNDLRTDRQLGYVVSAGAWVRVNTPGLFFVVQSPVVPPAAVEIATLEFLDNYRTRLANMSASAFETEREGFLSRLLERDQNLNSRGARLWRDLQDEVRTFDSRERIADAARELDLEAFRTFYDEFLELARTRVASTWAPGRFEVEVSTPGGRQIDDVDAFKSGRDHFMLRRGD